MLWKKVEGEGEGETERESVAAEKGRTRAAVVVLPTARVGE